MEKEMILSNLNEENFNSLNGFTLKCIKMVELGVLSSEDIQIHKLDTVYGELYIPKFFTDNSIQFESFVAQRLINYNSDKWDFQPIMKYSILLIQKNHSNEYIGFKDSYHKYLKILIDSLNKVDKSLIEMIDNPMEKVNTLFKELNKKLPNNVYFSIEMYRIIHNDYEDISEEFIDIFIKKLGFNLFFTNKNISKQ